jgi:glycosyltransferase involved in cell wall biosynthesis
MRRAGMFKPKVSCIVLAHDSQIDKADCVLHTLRSIFNQDYSNIELIFVENSHNKSVRLISAINNGIKCWNRKINPLEIKIINNKNSLDMGSSRNIGAKRSSGDILVFIDDDTIILEKNAFSRIVSLARKYDSGYGAKRLWTKGNLFQKNSKKILEELCLEKFSLVKRIVGPPPVMIRGSYQSQLLLSNTFITNFGFCTREKFFSIGSYPSYKGRGFHDDCLMYKLFKSNAKTILLDDMTVVHVNHTINYRPGENIDEYFYDLITDGYYWFHVEKIFKRKNYSKDKILERLASLHYDERIEKAFNYYLSLVPLDIVSDRNKQKRWREKYQESRIGFVRMIETLVNSNDLDGFVRQSDSDFDNIAPILSAAIESGIIEIDKKGKITSLISWKYQPINQIDAKKLKFQPSATINQFPCDERSSLRRIDFIRSRYPYCEYLKLGIIGDDDFFSAYSLNDKWIWPVIVELDSRIVKKIRGLSSRFDIIQENISDLILETKLLSSKKIQTFISDPPYTLNGSLAFMLTGLKMMEIDGQEKEFYLILNKTMMGKNLQNLIRIASNAGIFLTSVVPNFSHYKLPNKFEEKRRAKEFLKNININSGALNYSSSSSLYIFSTTNPKIKNLEQELDISKLYVHY